MEPHHAETVLNVVHKFEADPTVCALMLGGSIAHGFARPDADVDIATIVTEEKFALRRAETLVRQPQTRPLHRRDGESAERTTLFSNRPLRSSILCGAQNLIW